jgi:drug/metabolite transporter (DMT)-like permease
MQNHVSGKKQLGADALLLLTAFFWGITFAVVKQAIERMDVFVFLAQRFGLALAVMLPICLVFGRRPVLRDVKRGTALGIFLFGAFALQTLGLKYTSASNAGFLTGMNVVMVPIFAAILFRERVAVNARFGVALAALGLFFLCTRGTWRLNGGDLLVALCAVCIAFQIICTGRYAKKSDVFTLTTVQLGVVALLSALTAALLGNNVVVYHPQAVWAIVLCALFASVFAFLVQTSMQRFTTPTRTALLFCMEPVFGAVYARWALGEVLGPWGIVGAGLIFVGMVIAELPVLSELSAKSVIRSRCCRKVPRAGGDTCPGAEAGS